MKHITLSLIVLSCLISFSGCRAPADGTCKVVINKNGPNDYYSYNEEDGQWYFIMLPGTQIGFTAYDVNGKELGKSETKPGHPTLPADIEDLDAYFSEFRILSAQQVEDGCWCVERRYLDSGFETWTVWSDELMTEYKKRK